MALVKLLLFALAAVVTLVSAGATARPAAAPAEREIPRIHLLYPPQNGTVFDINCADLLKVTVNPAWVQEAVRRAPEFQARWDREAAAYLATTFDEVGLPFPYKEMQAALTVCPGVRSMSTPLVINVRRYLESSETRSPHWLLAETIYHELMHIYVRPVNAVSALRKKYAGEQPVVLNHLHVMALEKFVLTKLGRPEELAQVGLDYVNVLPPAYKRAWTIMHEIEGHQPFINELKQLARAGR
jgi:hypothetical protein